MKANMLRKIVLILPITLCFLSCSKNSSENNESKVYEYKFLRNGKSSVSFSGQTTRLKMTEELGKSLLINVNSKDRLLAMYATGKQFTEEALNTSGKTIKSKVAASQDFFKVNTSRSEEIKTMITDYITIQTDDVFVNWDREASETQSGYIINAEGKKRYVTKEGVENNQLFKKHLLGGLMLDQIVNNYLSTERLNDTKTRNDAGTLVEGKTYTDMEHYWDEAYGYLYGLESNPEKPVLGIDSYLNNYLGDVDEDDDFKGIATRIFNAFVDGRLAIVAKDYTKRDAQIKIIQTELSKVIAIKAIYYLQKTKEYNSKNDKYNASHALSEGIGFCRSLEFTRKPNEKASYLTPTEIKNGLVPLTNFWTVTNEKLDEFSNSIAEKFNLTITEIIN